LDSDSVFVVSMSAGSTLSLLSNKQSTPSSWSTILGPIGGGSGSGFVSGPGISTNDAVALWNGTTGQFIKNSSVIIDVSGDVSGVGTLATTGDAQIGGDIVLTASGQVSYSNGPGNTTTFANTPSGIHTWTFRNTTDSVLGLSTTDNLTNKTLISPTNNIAANYLNSASTQVRVDTSAAPSSGQVLTATSSTLAGWQTLPSSLTGPFSSTVNAIALWNSIGGSVLKNSTVLVDGSGNVGGVANLSMTGNASMTNLALAGGNLTFSNGGNSATLVAAPTGLRTLAVPDISDTLITRNTTDTLSNKTITSITNNVNANGLNTSGGSGAAVIVNTAASPGVGSSLIATSSTTATWQNVGTTPATTTQYDIPVFANTSGTSFSDSGVSIDVSQNVSGVGSLAFGSGLNKTTISNTPSGTNTMILPSASDTLVGRNTSDTLTNKIINYTPAISGNWLSPPTTVSSALDNLAATAGTNLTLGVDPSATATGATQGTAYLISKYFTNVSTTPVGSGVILPSASAGTNYVVKNNGANSLNVYPASGQTINALLANTAISVGSGGGSTRLIAVSGTNWQTF
jgi:hypothetical protein